MHDADDLIADCGRMKRDWCRDRMKALQEYLIILWNFRSGEGSMANTRI
jgi:hypothetical protein